jgi:hypothetical protein
MQARNTDLMRFTHLSRHARKRVKQRTQLTNLQLSAALDQNLVVNTGCKPGLHREHLLFYSTQDECCFVAIRDKLTGKVVTVLPLDFHDNLAWPISDMQVQKAKALMHIQSPELESLPTVAHVPELPSALVVSCAYADAPGKLRYKVLVKVNAAAYQNDIGTFMHCPKTSDLLDVAAKSKGIDPALVVTLTVRIGNKGNPQTWVFISAPMGTLGFRAIACLFSFSWARSGAS